MRRKLHKRYGRATARKSRKYSVRLHGKWIDAVFQNSPWPNKAEREDDVKRSLVNHDGYDSDIDVTETK